MVPWIISEFNRCVFMKMRGRGLYFIYISWERHWHFLGDCCSFSFSRFLGNIREAFDKNPELVSLLLDDFFKKAVHDAQVIKFWFNLM